jgi:hypothetical protein
MIAASVNNHIMKCCNSSKFRNGMLLMSASKVRSGYACLLSRLVVHSLAGAWLDIKGFWILLGMCPCRVCWGVYFDGRRREADLPPVTFSPGWVVIACISSALLARMDLTELAKLCTLVRLAV